MIAVLFEFFDVGFMRLLWVLFVEYLVATHFLNPEQKDMWVEGIGHIISIGGTVVFLAIWQYHSHKKGTKVVRTTVATAPESVVTTKTEQLVTTPVLEEGSETMLPAQPSSFIPTEPENTP